MCVCFLTKDENFLSNSDVTKRLFWDYWLQWPIQGGSAGKGSYLLLSSYNKLYLNLLEKGCSLRPRSVRGVPLIFQWNV